MRENKGRAYCKIEFYRRTEYGWWIIQIYTGK